MKILYVTTIGSTMGFFTSLIESLLDQGHSVDIACNTEAAPVPQMYLDRGCNVHKINCTRSPISLGNLVAIRQIYRVVHKHRYDVVHCHTPTAAVCTRIACASVRKKKTKMIYTAHGFHFYKGAPLKNWLLFYPIEWLCAYLTDVLITINQEDYTRAKKRLKAKQIIYVPGVGIDMDRFGVHNADREKIRKELGIPAGARLLISVGELNENKNHQLVLKAISELKQSDVYYIIAGEGKQRDALIAQAEALGISDKVHTLGFRTDVSDLCSVSDCFVFPSYREGLSVSVMEAMACKLPCAVSRIRGNTDLIDEQGGALFDPSDAESCRKAIDSILSGATDEMGKYNRKKVYRFSQEKVIEEMKSIYGCADD